MLHIRHAFPCNSAVENNYLDLEGGKDTKGTPFSVFFSEMWSYLEKCNLKLMWVYWPSDELSEVSITYSVLSSCSVLYSVSPADKSKPLQHHLLLMPYNLCRPDFVISVTTLILSKHKLIFFFSQSRWCLEETEFSKVSNEISIWSNPVQREKLPL